MLSNCFIVQRKESNRLFLFLYLCHKWKVFVRACVRKIFGRTICLLSFGISERDSIVTHTCWWREISLSTSINRIFFSFSSRQSIVELGQWRWFHNISGKQNRHIKYLDMYVICLFNVSVIPKVIDRRTRK